MILDTNAVSGVLAGDLALAAVLDPEPRHHLPVVVIGEYRYGLLRSKHRRELDPLLDQLVDESIVLNLDQVTANTYAALRHQLRAQGTPIPENDVWIGALALQHRLRVVTRDQHFDHVKGLHRVPW